MNPSTTYEKHVTSVYLVKCRTRASVQSKGALIPSSGLLLTDILSRGNLNFIQATSQELLKVSIFYVDILKVIITTNQGTMRK